MAFGAPGAGDRVVAAVRSLPDPEVGGAAVAHLALADELDLLVHPARRHAHRQARGAVARQRGDGVDAGAFGDEGAVLLDLGGGAGRENPVRRLAGDEEADGQVLDGVPVAVHARSFEPDDVAGARLVGRSGQFQAVRGVRGNRDLDLGGGVLGGRGEGGPAGRQQVQAAEPVGRGHARVGAGVADLDVVADDVRDVDDPGAKRQVGAGVEGAGEVDDLDALDRRVRDRHVDLDAQQGFRPPRFVFGFLGHQGDDGDLSGTVRLDLAGRVDPEPPAVAREEDDVDVLDRVAVLVHHGGGQRRLVADFEGQFGRLDLELRAGRDRRFVVLRLALGRGIAFPGRLGLLGGFRVRLRLGGGFLSACR